MDSLSVGAQQSNVFVCRCHTAVYAVVTVLHMAVSTLLHMCRQVCCCPLVEQHQQPRCYLTSMHRVLARNRICCCHSHVVKMVSCKHVLAGTSGCTACDHA